LLERFFSFLTLDHDFHWHTNRDEFKSITSPDESKPQILYTVTAKGVKIVWA
jgi:hypothetical protein